MAQPRYTEYADCGGQWRIAEHGAQPKAGVPGRPLTGISNHDVKLAFSHLAHRLCEGARRAIGIVLWCKRFRAPVSRPQQMGPFEKRLLEVMVIADLQNLDIGQAHFEPSLMDGRLRDS